MCSLRELADKVVGPCSEIAQYKKNMKELEDEKKELEKQMKENEEQVEATRAQGETVKPDEVEWADMAKKMICEAEELINDKATYESVECLKLSCPNLISRYQMSKKSKQKIGDLKGHIQVGDSVKVARRVPSLKPQFLSSGDFVDIDSRKRILKMIKDGLEKPTVNTIAVYGPEGAGKTTIVREVDKKMRDRTFDETMFAVVSQDVNIHTIQEQIAKCLSMKLRSLTERGRAKELWYRLSNEKNKLVILDDLWQELDLKAIGIPLREENKGCKVILTTRDRNVLEKMKVDEYIQVEVLSDDESWNLFKKKLDTTLIFDESLALSICKRCGGMPGSILAVGEALAGKEDIVHGIKAKSILLLCCLYPKDADIPVDLLVFHCIARLFDQSKDKVEKARDQIFALVDYLKRNSLLLHGKNEKFVKMPDVVRDVVLSIAKKEEPYLVKDDIDKWPDINDNLAAVSIRTNKLKDVPNELVIPQLHTLRIECMDSSFQFPDNIFSGVSELMILELKGIRMLKSPSSLANLSKLGTLILMHCQLEDMSFLKGLKSLEVLVIASCDIKALPLELGELSLLRVLLLNESVKLKLIPAGVISKLTQLEELSMPNNFDFNEELRSVGKDAVISRATLSELNKLTNLTSLSVFIPDVTQILDLRFDNLVSYRLEVGSRFEGRYGHLRRKNLKLAEVTYNDKLRNLLERVQVLHLKRIKGLENFLLDKVGKGFLELECLVVEDCHGLKCLLGTPNRPNSFSKLSVVEVVGCSFESLFVSSCAKGLQVLQKLEVRHCNLLEEIIETQGEDVVCLNKLNKINFVRLPKLISFSPKVIKKNGTVERDRQPLFNEKVTFPSLQYLVIEGCSSITEIWDKEADLTDHFPQLVDVQVFECKKLVNVFPSRLFTLAQNLKNISVGCCKGVEFVVSITGVEKQSSKTENNQTISFPNLSNVTLIDLENIKSFCGSSTPSEPHLFDPQVTFPALRSLFIQSLSNIIEIWDKKVVPTDSFPQLATVRICDCEKLVNVFPSNLWAQGMREVRIGGCKGLEVVVSSTGIEKSFPQLSELYLTNLENLKTFWGDSTESEPQSLFDAQVQFPALSLLFLQNMPNLETFMQQLSKGELQAKFPVIKEMPINDPKTLAMVWFEPRVQDIGIREIVVDLHGKDLQDIGIREIVVDGSKDLHGKDLQDIGIREMVVDGSEDLHGKDLQDIGIREIVVDGSKDVHGKDLQDIGIREIVADGSKDLHDEV